MTFLLALTLLALAPDRGRVDAVDTRRGTDSAMAYSRGNTFPAAARPFGYNFWSPVTDGFTNAWLYQFRAPALQAFRVGHQPSPWIGDYAALQIWPTQGPVQYDPTQRAAAFDHGNETARLYRYDIRLNNGIEASLVPTERAAILAFSYPAAAQSNVIFDGVRATHGQLAPQGDTGALQGVVEDAGQRLYVYAQLLNKQNVATAVRQGPLVGASWTFATAPNETVTVLVGTSFISVEQAQANVRQEVAGKTLTQVSDEGAAAWEKIFGQVDVQGGAPEVQQIFYANLARAHMYPNARWEDVNGQPQYHSPYNGQVQPGKIWVNNGFWDTYRAAWPLYMLLHPQLAGDMLQGFVNAYHDGGWTPRWSGPGYADCMVGTHTDIVFADAKLRNVPNIDYAAAYEASVKNATVVPDRPSYGRKGNSRAGFLGFVPNDMVPEATAWHLEDAINDFGIAQMANSLGDAAQARYFTHRANSYVNSFSPEVGFFRGKNADATWRTSDAEFQPNVWGYEFTEGCPWHYLTAAAFDVRGMAALYGGAGALEKKLDAMMNAPANFLQGSYSLVIHEMREAYDTGMGQYAHANEPAMHMLYMYDYLGAAHKTQRYVRHVLDPNSGIYVLGGVDGAGYLGDEDNGQMSAWYVFSAMGLYPAAPGHGEYALGSPAFSRADLHLESGKNFTVEAVHNSPENIYVQRASWRGAPLRTPFLRHDAVQSGGVLRLEMGPKPSPWGGEPGAVVGASASISQKAPQPLLDLTRAVHGHAAFDDDAATTWCTDTGTQGNFELPAVGEGRVELYTLTSAAAAHHDPEAWQLQASDDGQKWENLDARQREGFAWRRQTRVFAVSAPRRRAYHRLVLLREGAAVVCLSEVEFLATATNCRENSPSQ